MDTEDKQIVIIEKPQIKYTLEEMREKFWRIDTTFEIAEDYYDAERWIPAESPGWVPIDEKAGGKDRRRFKNPEQGKEILKMPEPNASALMLNAARKSYKSARLLVLDKEHRTAKAEESDELEVSEIIFDMLEEDMKSIIMSYTAIEAFVNETVRREDEIYIAKKGKTIATRLSYEDFRRMALEEKLYRVLPEKLKLPPIAKDGKDGKDDTWQKYKELEDLRHAIIHMEGEGRRSNVIEKPNVIWKRIYEAGVRWGIPAYERAFRVIKHFSRSQSGEYPNWIVNFPQA